MFHWARHIVALVLVSLLVAEPARAQLTIEIVGAAGTATPIAIVPFENESSWPLGVTGIVGSDLSRSGYFKLVDYAGVVPRPTRAEEVRSADWTARGADASAGPEGRRPRAARTGSFRTVAARGVAHPEPERVGGV